MKFEEIVRRISDDFTHYWNVWDIEAILSFISEHVILRSPNVSKVFPSINNNTIVGKENVRHYWEQLAQRNLNYKVIQTSVTKTDRTITTYNLAIKTNIVIREIFILDEYGKIIELNYEYPDTD